MEPLQSGQLQPGAEQTAPENPSNRPVSRSLFRLLFEVEAELRKLTQKDVRALRDKLPILSRTKDPEQIRGASLSRYIIKIKYFRSSHVRKASDLVAATMILTSLAYAGRDNGKGNEGQNNGKQNGQQIPVVPEANPVWVLVPFFGGVLLFSTRRLFKSKA